MNDEHLQSFRTDRTVAEEYEELLDFILDGKSFSSVVPYSCVYTALRSRALERGMWYRSEKDRWEYWND